MKKILITILSMAALGLYADGLALWKSQLPGYRQGLDVSGLPEKIFSLKLDSSAKQDAIPVEADSIYKGIVEKIKAMPVTGIIWSNTPGERRVLIGDIVLREGQAIPSYVFNDGKYYILVEMSQSKLHFKVQEADLSTPFAFDIPFGLKEPMKNQSTFSTGGDAKK